MNRQQFMKSVIQGGICGCAAALGLMGNLPAQTSGRADKPEAAPQGWIDDLERRMVKGSETPAWRRAEKGELWIADLVAHMDVMLDRQTAVQLMQACGRSCYRRAFGAASRNRPDAAAAKAFLSAMENRGYRVRREETGTTVIYNWGRDHQNPWGLIMSDGYCMCPLMESGKVKISPTFCFCSTGYVKESFERSLGRSVEVELLDSLKMGGRDCVFQIGIPKA